MQQGLRRTHIIKEYPRQESGLFGNKEKLSPDEVDGLVDLAVQEVCRHTNLSNRLSAMRGKAGLSAKVIFR